MPWALLACPRAMKNEKCKIGNAKQGNAMVVSASV
jgi:hypothetical protein